MDQYQQFYERIQNNAKMNPNDKKWFKRRNQRLKPLSRTLIITEGTSWYCRIMSRHSTLVEKAFSVDFKISWTRLLRDTKLKGKYTKITNFNSNFQKISVFR